MSDSQACKSVAKRNDNQITRINANRRASIELTGDPTGPKIFSATVGTGMPITSTPSTRERISPCLRSASAALLLGSNASTTCESDIAPHIRCRAGHSALAVPHPPRSREAVSQDWCHGREKREHGWLESERKHSTHQDIIWNALSTCYTPDDAHTTCGAPGSRFRCSLHGGSLQSHHHHIVSAFGWETATSSCHHADFESDALAPFLLPEADGFIRLLQQSWSTACRDISPCSGVRIRIRPVDACPCKIARDDLLRALRTASFGLPPA